MKVFALIYDEDDTYDIGSHEAVMELFTDRETADRVADALLGNRKNRHLSAVWGPYDGLEVREMEIR